MWCLFFTFLSDLISKEKPSFFFFLHCIHFYCVGRRRLLIIVPLLSNFLFLSIMSEVLFVYAFGLGLSLSAQKVHVKNDQLLIIRLAGCTIVAVYHDKI